MVWRRTPLPFILITGALQRQLEPGQALMSAHSLSPALCPHIKARDPPVPGGGKRAAGTLLVPWLLPRAGWMQGGAGDRLHQMGPEERGLWGGGSLCCLARAFRAHLSPWPGGLLWHCWQRTWAQTDPSDCTFPSQLPQTPLTAPSRPSSLRLRPKLQRFWEGPMGRMPGSAPACLPVPQPLARSPLVPRDSLAGSKEEPRQSRNSKGGQASKPGHVPVLATLHHPPVLGLLPAARAQRNPCTRGCQQPCEAGAPA